MRPSYFDDGNSYNDKTSSLYWNKAKKCTSFVRLQLNIQYNRILSFHQDVTGKDLEKEISQNGCFNNHKISY